MRVPASAMRRSTLTLGRHPSPLGFACARSGKTRWAAFSVTTRRQAAHVGPSNVTRIIAPVGGRTIVPIRAKHRETTRAYKAASLRLSSLCRRRFPAVHSGAVPLHLLTLSVAGLKFETPDDFDERFRSGFRCPFGQIVVGLCSPLGPVACLSRHAQVPQLAPSTVASDTLARLYRIPLPVRAKLAPGLHRLRNPFACCARQTT